MFKKIRALIDPLNLNEVEEALEELGIQWVTISKCKNFGPLKGPAMIFRGKKQASDSLSEIRLEMVVDQEMAGKVVETIQKADGGGKNKDGRIFVQPIEEFVSLETPECGGRPSSGVGT